MSNPAERRNYVAKHSRSKSGAGAHEAKVGEQASRQRQKRKWKRDVTREI